MAFNLLPQDPEEPIRSRNDGVGERQGRAGARLTDTDVGPRPSYYVLGLHLIRISGRCRPREDDRTVFRSHARDGEGWRRGHEVLIDEKRLDAVVGIEREEITIAEDGRAGTTDSGVCVRGRKDFLIPPDRAGFQVRDAVDADIGRHISRETGKELLALIH